MIPLTRPHTLYFFGVTESESEVHFDLKITLKKPELIESNGCQILIQQPQKYIMHMVW